MGPLAIHAAHNNAGLQLARELNSSWDLAYGLVYLSNAQASVGDGYSALRTIGEAIEHAEAAEAGYPLNLARFYLLWQQEAGLPVSPDHGLQIDLALRGARVLGLDGLAMCLAWLRLLHRTADPSVSQERVARELDRRMQTVALRLPVKGPWERLGLQLVHSLHRQRRGVDTSALETLVNTVFSEKLETLLPADRDAFRATYECRTRWP
jgi:hypothetical protein